MTHSSKSDFHESFGSLRGCLVEGDAEQRRQERRIQRRALSLSVVMQCAVLAALLIVPLFAKTAHLAVATFIPVPPYHPPAPVHSVTNVAPGPQHPRNLDFNAQSVPTHIPNHIAAADTVSAFADQGDRLQSLAIGNAAPCAPAAGCIPLEGSHSAPPPPPPRGVHTVHVTKLDPAMLVYRVEPVYPAPARQLRISGSVVLHALISTDGSVQALAVVSGHPMLNRSALDAVQQWRYRPTLLNGQPVQVDTFVTVIYRLQD